MALRLFRGAFFVYGLVREERGVAARLSESPPIELAEQSGGGGKVGIERKGVLRGDARGVDVSQSRQNRGPRIRRARIGRVSRFSTQQCRSEERRAGKE